jgi:DNA polymerase-1
VNYQNIPRKSKEIKRCFIPKQDALVFFDYGQIEARLAAYFFSKLGWDGLLNDIINGVDVHRRMAAVIYGVPESQVTEEMRDRAKTTFFGQLYGAGAKRVAEILNATGPANWREFTGKPLKQSEAKKIVTAFRDEMPGLEILQDACQWAVNNKGYLELFTGRRLKPEKYGEHKLPNALIQGTAADILKRALRRIHAHLKERPGIASHLVSNVHDEAVMDAPMRELPYLYNAIPNLMDEPEFSSVIPIVIEMEYSTTNWAEKAPYPQEEPDGDVESH